MTNPAHCLCINHFYREGTNHYVCTKCKKDITLEVVWLADIGHRFRPQYHKTEDGFEKIPTRRNGTPKA